MPSNHAVNATFAGVFKPVNNSCDGPFSHVEFFGAIDVSDASESLRLECIQRETRISDVNEGFEVVKCGKSFRTCGSCRSAPTQRAFPRHHLEKASRWFVSIQSPARRSPPCAKRRENVLCFSFALFGISLRRQRDFQR